MKLVQYFAQNIIKMRHSRFDDGSRMVMNYLLVRLGLWNVFEEPESALVVRLTMLSEGRSANFDPKIIASAPPAMETP